MKENALIGALLLLGIILVGTAPLAVMQGGGFEKPVMMPDQAALHRSFMDMWSIGLTDDGENLTIIVELGAPLPTLFYEDFDTMEHGYGIYMEVYVDLDNNVSTGTHISALGGVPRSSGPHPLNGGFTTSGSADGIDAMMFVEYYHANYQDGTRERLSVVVIYFYPNGSAADHYLLPSPTYIAEGSMVKFPLNLTKLTMLYNEATGRNIKVPKSLKVYLFPWIISSLYDKIPEQAVTVPGVNITADGDPSDWAGIQPILVDTRDPISFGTLGDLNITRVYMATNGTHLFVRIDVDSPPADQGDLYVDSFIYIYFDDDGDGGFGDDYYIKLDLRNLGGLRLGYDGTEIGADIRSGCTSARSGSVYEAAVNITKLSSASRFTQNFTLNVSNADNMLPVKAALLAEVYDDSPTPPPFIAYGFEQYPLIYYVMGVGGSIGSSIEASMSGSGVLRFGNATIAVNTTGSINTLLGVYPGDPLGWSGLERPIVPYHYFNMTPLSNVEWPIIINITYDEAALNGASEESLIPYYYDKNTGSYEQVPEPLYTIDTQANIVSITVTQDLYMAGDPVIVIGSPLPSPGVGGILLQEEENTITTMILAATAAVMGTITLVYVRTKRK